MYEMPNVSEWNPFLSILQYPNEVSGYFFWVLILVATFIIMVFWFSRFKLQNAVLASSFVTMILSIVFRGLGLVGDLIMFVFISITGLSLLWVELTKDKEQV